MKSRIITQALSASAVILLSAGAMVPATATESTPSSEVTAPTATTAGEVDQYDLFYLMPEQVEGSSNTWSVAPMFFWKNEGGDYGIPEGFSFELVSASPELNAKMVDSKGVVTISPEQKLDMNKEYSFTVRTTGPDGSTSLIEIPFYPQDIYTDAIAHSVEPKYTETSLHVDKSWTTQTIQLADPTIMEKVKSVKVGTPNQYDDIVGAVDPKTGALTLTNTNPDSKFDIGNSVVVYFTYLDGSTNFTSVNVFWDAGYTIADQKEPMYGGEAANPVETGKTYSAEPVWLDKFDGTEVAGPAGGVKASLVSSNSTLNATIDEATGKVSFHFDTLPTEKTEYKFTVRFTYSDGSTEDVEFSYLVTAQNTTESTETPAPSPSESSEAAVPAPGVLSTPTADSSNPTESAVATPTDSAETATDEPTTAEQPTDVAAEAVTEPNAGSPAGVDPTEAETQLAQSSLRTASSESASQATNEQSAVLASTGAKNAVLVFFAGLVALGTGTALVVRRKHS